MRQPAWLTIPILLFTALATMVILSITEPLEPVVKTIYSPYGLAPGDTLVVDYIRNDTTFLKYSN
jgi:hypothetical protein